MRFQALLLPYLLFAGTLAAENTATLPVPRANPSNWVQRHEGFVAQAKQGDIEVLFLGDSITDGWRNKGKAIWAEAMEPTLEALLK